MKLQYIFGIICLYSNIAANTLTVQDENINSGLVKKFREMKSFMNTTVDPCENLYEYACGNWINIHPAEDNANMETNYLLLIKSAFDEKAIAILNNTNDPNETDVDKKVKNFYNSCLKLKNGIEPEKLVKVISEFGKMPALEGNDWNEKDFDWIETLAEITRQFGFQVMIGIDILADMRDNSKNRVYIGEAKFDLESKSIYLDDVGAMYRMMYKIAVGIKLQKLLNITENIATTTANEIVDFEILLAKGMKENKKDEQLNTLLLNTTVDEMQQKYAPTIDIKKFLNIILKEIPNEMIYEYVPNYMLNLKNVVEKTEKRIIANYLYYHLVKIFSLDTSSTKDELEQNCLDKIKEQFPENIDNMVYRSFKTNNNNKYDTTEDDLQQIWNKLKILFKSKLELNIDNNLDWLTVQTRRAAIEKLETIKLQISSYTERDFKQELQNLETYENDYVKNLQNIMQVNTKRNFDKLHKPIGHVEAGETMSLTPANILTENVVKIPVAFLQPYFVWSPDFPDALKFGIAGYLLAHELIHSFDDTGRQFGKMGNLENWWDQESQKAFEQRRECFIDQYQQYIYGGNPLPRSEIQAENVADNSGLKLAYGAFIDAQTNSHEMIVDNIMGMNMTSKQLFFIGFAQFWCSDLHSILLSLQTEVDTHTPGKYRVIGTVSNLEEFAEAFECKTGTKMNPTVKCKML